MKISDSDRDFLLTVARSATLEHRLVVRAKILLRLADGQSYMQIQKGLDVAPGTISRMVSRYREHGVAGLQDEPRSGKPRTIGESVHQLIIHLACSKPPDGYSTWSQQRIADAVGVSKSSVQKVLSRHELRPHKVEQWCGKSPDPEFEPKMMQIIGLYMNPPENALVLCVDEKTQIQALERSQPELPMRAGSARRQTATYVRHGTVSLVAALAVHQGDIVAQPIERNDSSHFLAFLKRLDRTYRHKHLHIIVDNLAVHKHADVKAWLSRKRKITLHFTPTYSSWLNQIEIWFNMLTRDVLKGGIWTSKEQLVRQLLTYVDTYNKTRAKPFTWTYDGTKNTSGTKKP